MFSFSSEAVKRQVLVELISLSMSDNKYDQTEMKILNRIANRFGISPQMAERLTASVVEIMSAYTKLAAIISE